MDPRKTAEISMAYRVTNGQGCSGEWNGWLDLGETAEAAFAVAQPDMPPPGLYWRGFTPSTAPGSCGMQLGFCADEFVGELRER
jgi:hypothetical protein